MKTPKPIYIRNQNDSLLRGRIFRNQKNIQLMTSEKSITTNESYNLSTERNQTNSNLNSIISPRFITIINNKDSNQIKRRIPNSISKLPKISRKKIISDADYLVKERKKHEDCMPSHLPVNISIQKSNEINMKNYLIRKIKEKRAEIMHNEKKIIQQFKIRQKEFDKQYKTFLNTAEESQKSRKEEDDELNMIKMEIIEKEKILRDLKIENKKFEDSLKRMINSIIAYKKYGSFIHKIFEQKFIYDDLDDIHGKDYYKIMQKFIEVYENNQKDLSASKKEEEFLDNLLFQGEEQFFWQYKNIEESLRSQMETRNDIFNELINLSIKNKNEIDELNAKKNENEKDKIINDQNRIIQTRMMDNIKNYGAEDSKTYLAYIIELGESIGEIKHKGINIESIGENLLYCNETMELLEEKEHYINKYINEIENVFNNGNSEDVMLIEKIINDRKKYNKVQKLFEAKQIQEEIRMKKNLKTINTNRVVIKGRKVIQDFPLIRGQKKKKKITVKKDNEELDYLYYSSDEN